MTIEQMKTPCFLSVCDKCGETYQHDGDILVHFESEADARNGGWSSWRGQVLCDDCPFGDDEEEGND